jgi:hypothetical protein
MAISSENLYFYSINTMHATSLFILVFVKLILYKAYTNAYEVVIKLVMGLSSDNNQIIRVISKLVNTILLITNKIRVTRTSISNSNL